MRPSLRRRKKMKKKRKKERPTNWRQGPSGNTFREFNGGKNKHKNSNGS